MGWLREPGRKTESALVQATRDVYSSFRFPSRLCMAIMHDLDLKGLSEEIKQKQGAGACFLLDSYDEWIWKKDFIHQLFF